MGSIHVTGGFSVTGLQTAVLKLEDSPPSFGQSQ